MKITCKILRVDRLNDRSVGLILQPLVFDCPPFPFIDFDSNFEYQVGEYLELDFVDIIIMMNSYFWTCVYSDELK